MACFCLNYQKALLVMTCITLAWDYSISFITEYYLLEDTAKNERDWTLDESVDIVMQISQN